MSDSTSILSCMTEQPSGVKLILRVYTLKIMCYHLLYLIRLIFKDVMVPDLVDLGRQSRAALLAWRAP